jgi:hypothetical protein
VHEAQVQPENFSPSSPWYVEVSAGRFCFGRHLITGLLEMIRTDRLGRDEFRDLLSEYENIVDPRSNKEKIWEDLQKGGVSQGRLHMLERVVVGLRPERILAMSVDELKHAFRRTTVESPVFQVHFGALQRASIVDADEWLTDKGCKVLKRLSEAYKTIDAGGLEAVR